ncbi:MAG: hypothetical protein SF053_09835 [Bacteroidia bacterium]|nr:hypothetical protein [Bacteroidia bacterium]
MRKTKAYILLAILLISWTERFIILEETEYVEIRHQMNILEQRIAAEVAQSIGVHTLVQLMPTPEFPVRGMVYGDQGFSIELDGQVYYYSLLDEAHSTSLQAITRAKPVTSEEQEREMILIKKLTSEHVPPAHPLLQEVNRTTSPAVWHSPDMFQDLILPVPVPPPDLA